MLAFAMLALAGGCKGYDQYYTDQPSPQPVAPTTFTQQVVLPTPTPSATVVSVQETPHDVKSGAFCSEHGQFGYTATNKLMQCTTIAGDPRYRWR